MIEDPRELEPGDVVKLDEQYEAVYEGTVTNSHTDETMVLLRDSDGERWVCELQAFCDDWTRTLTSP